MRQPLPRSPHLTRPAAALLAAAAATGAITTGPTAEASERRFTYVYEADTQPVGVVEYEQWVTWKTDKDSDSSFDRIDFRHELEFGLNDALQLGLYLSDWRYQGGRSVADDGAEWRNAAVELIYNLRDPVTEPWGLALYGELKLGDELFEVETKLIVQKNMGKWILAWNGIFEAEWEGERFDEDKGELAQTLGASYQLDPSWLVGLELLHEIEYDDWSEWEDHVLYAGPNFSHRTGTWWLTTTLLAQVTDVESEPNLQLRCIFGFDF